MRELEKIKKEREEERARKVGNTRVPWMWCWWAGIPLSRFVCPMPQTLADSPLAVVRLSCLVVSCRCRVGLCHATQAAEEEALAAKARETAALTGNPLLASSTKSTTARVKRRWDDDVVFRNQARDEKRPRKRFINDAIRSDFHRKFLNKYIQ